MNLAVVHPYLYTRGGAEKVVLKIAQHFNAKVYCSRYDPAGTYPEFADIDVEVIKTRLSSAVPSFLPSNIRDSILSGYGFYSKEIGSYDVVNAHGTPSEWIVNHNSPVVWYCHTPNRKASDLYERNMCEKSVVGRLPYWLAVKAYRRVESRLAPKIKHVFANSGNTQMRLRKYFNVGSEVLHPGIDFEEFYCVEYGKYFFYPSRIAPEKRFEYAIEAFKKFRRKHPGFKLVIAGALFSERPDHVAYYKRIKKMLGGDGEVLVDIPRWDLVDLFARCYSVLYSPVNEDFGLIPLEALASYKPVVAVNEGGPTEVVSDGVDGFLVDSVDGMVEKMSLLAGDVGLVEKMGKAGRKKVEKNFNWKKFMDRFKEVCREVSRS